MMAQKQPTVPGYYTVQQIAEILAVSPGHVRELIEEGSLQAESEEGSYRVAVGDFQKYLKSQRPPES